MHRRASLPGLPSKTVVKRSIKQAAQGTAVGEFVEHLELVEVREQCARARRNVATHRVAALRT
jgi:hypothetical protein